MCPLFHYLLLDLSVNKLCVYVCVCVCVCVSVCMYIKFCKAWKIMNSLYLLLVK